MPSLSVPIALLTCCLTTGLLSFPVSDWTAIGGTSPDERRYLSQEWESELETKAKKQLALSMNLERAAERAAYKAKQLQAQAEAAKLRAFEAVAQEQALLQDARRSAPSETDWTDTEPQLDPLMMDSAELTRAKRTMARPRSPNLLFLVPAADPNELEALRVLYLQNLLASRDRSTDLAELLQPAHRLVYRPADFGDDDSPFVERDLMMRLEREGDGTHELSQLIPAMDEDDADVSDSAELF